MGNINANAFRLGKQYTGMVDGKDQGDTILVNDGNGKLKKSAMFNSGNIFRWMRSDTTKHANNEIREQLLQNLGKLLAPDFNLTKKGGHTEFSSEFMDKLENILGADVFKKKDFGVGKNGGSVSSGRPLTARRINAIMARVAKLVDEPGKITTNSLLKMVGTKAIESPQSSQPKKSGFDPNGVLHGRYTMDGNSKNHALEAARSSIVIILSYKKASDPEETDVVKTKRLTSAAFGGSLKNSIEDFSTSEGAKTGNPISWLHGFAEHLASKKEQLCKSGNFPAALQNCHTADDFELALEKDIANNACGSYFRRFHLDFGFGPGCPSYERGFETNNKTFSSQFTPCTTQTKADNKFPAAFGVSKLIGKDKANETKSTVLRCGSAYTNEPNEIDLENAMDRYKNIAKSMINNNPKMMQLIAESLKDNAKPEITLPMFMFNAGDSLWPKSQEFIAKYGTDGFDMTVNMNGEDKTITVKPQFNECYVPLSGNESKFYTSREETLASAQNLLDMANLVRGTDKMVDKLVAQIKQGVERLKAGDNGMPGGVQYLPAYLCQVAARMVLLSHKLGLVPLINCHHGRDRTGMLDTFVKMYASMEPEELPELHEVSKKDEQDENWKKFKKMASEFLVKTGNMEMARNIAILNANLNLQQSDGGRQDLTCMFDIETLNTLLVQDGHEPYNTNDLVSYW